MEKISFMSAAQRRGCSVEEIEQLVNDGKLEEVSKGKVSKEALLKLNGLGATGKQTKSSNAGRKPNVMLFQDAAAYLNTDLAGVKALVEKGVLEVDEGAGGVRGSKEAQVKMLQKKLEGRETKSENKDQKEKSKDDTIPLIEDDKKEEEKDTSDEAFDLHEVMQELFEGVQLLPKELRAVAVRTYKKCEVKYNAHELKEVADISYKMGKLAVYESMGEFKRKVRS